jgi:2-polyprenyl-6-methoxyphenol hydroxylase-like FAD-dependent oxidoreductase
LWRFHAEHDNHWWGPLLDNSELSSLGTAEIDVDVLIVGGGPAGLLTAASLCQKHRVALIERAALGETKKYWLTTYSRLQKHRLEHCVLHNVHTMKAGSFLGSEAFAEGDFSVVDDSRFLQTLIERCRAGGAQMVETCALLNISWTPERVKAHTTRGTFIAKLVVDATGGLSPIAQTFRMHKIDGFYSVYGAHLDQITLETQDIVLGYVTQLGDPPPVLEIYPTSDHSAYCAVFVYSKLLVDPQSLAAAFEYHCLNNPFFTPTAQTVRSREKSGVIPIGQRRRKRLRGLVSIGEAGAVQPPLMGTAFNEVLEYATLVCAKLSAALNQPTGIAEVSSSLYPMRKRALDRFQLLLARILISGNVEVFDRLIRMFARFSRPLMYNLFCNDLSWGELIYIVIRMPWPRLLRYRFIGQ